jgi:hypothetical protein
MRVIFATQTDTQGGVNAVWDTAGVRFWIREVRVHKFPPPEDLLDPRGGAKFEEALKDLVAQFHRDRAINVYLWKEIVGVANGFGRSPISGNGKATVWLDTFCDAESLDGCATLAAHELGHALGLYHVGPGACDHVDSSRRDTCLARAGTCVSVPSFSDRLMALGVRGRQLCAMETEAAQQMARDKFN